MTTDLISKSITPAEVFVPKGLDPLIEGVRKKVEEFQKEEFDLEKKKDRDKIRSFSSNVAKSKTFIDKARIAFVKEKKESLKIIDQECKRFRDTLDEIRDEVRKPLTEWEEAEKIRVENERQYEIYLMEWDDAIAEDDIFNRERDIRIKEAKFEKVEADRKAKEDAEHLEKERIENESRIKKEAAEKAECDAENKIKTEREAKEKAERDKLQAEDNAKLAAEKAVYDAKEKARWAENDRIQAEKKAKSDQEAAVKKAQDDAAAKTKRDTELENIRLAGIKEEAERKASNKRHQASVNNKILSGLIEFGIGEDQAKNLVIHIAKGGIPKLRIEY
jgi:hypothetical protein